MRKTLVLVFDGFDPAYYEAAATPHLDRLAQEGFFRRCEGVVPSVTNVNHVSCLTATYPEAHGIAANYWYDPATAQGEFIETATHLRQPLLFTRLRDLGRTTALLVSKGKLLRLLGGDATTAIAAERPPADWIDALGPPAPIYSAEVDYWLLDALLHLGRSQRPDFIYCTTTDYTFHKNAPESDAAQAYMSALDERVGRIVDCFADYTILVTADHGMARKERALDLRRLLAAAGISATFVPVIKDRYQAHHDNLAGIGYLYVPANTVAAAKEVLAATKGVEQVLTRTEAAAQFRLPPDRIGDLVAFAVPEVVFGDLETTSQDVTIRTHGSPHERTVPLFGWQCPFLPAACPGTVELGQRLSDLIRG